jgi:hypothetical protein
VNQAPKTMRKNMKGKLRGFDFELNTLTIQFDSLDDFEFSVRDVELVEINNACAEKAVDHENRIKSLELTIGYLESFITFCPKCKNPEGDCLC